MTSMPSSRQQSINDGDMKHQTFTITLTLPQPTFTNSMRDKSIIKKRNLNSTCRKWGMNVVRELLYVQNNVGGGGGDFAWENDTGSNKENQFMYNVNTNDAELHREEKNNLYNHSNDSSSSTIPRANLAMIVVDGCKAFRMKDQLVITDLLRDPQSGTCVVQEVGIKPGDIIHALNGMVNPTLDLLFTVMRNSTTFQITIKRDTKISESAKTVTIRNASESKMIVEAKLTDKIDDRISNETNLLTPSNETEKNHSKIINTKNEAVISALSIKKNPKILKESTKGNTSQNEEAKRKRKKRKKDVRNALKRVNVPRSTRPMIKNKRTLVEIGGMPLFFV